VGSYPYGIEDPHSLRLIGLLLDIAIDVECVPVAQEELLVKVGRKV
jgi:hypothetical protein